MDQLLQIAVQVPVVAAVCFVGWKLGVLGITKWADGDKERTRVMAESFANLLAVVTEHAKEDAENHAQLRGHLGIDTTPVEGIRRRTPPRGLPVVGGQYHVKRAGTKDDR